MGDGPIWNLEADERGHAAVEYALLAAMVAVIALSGLRILGGGTHGLYGMLAAVAAALAG